MRGLMLLLVLLLSLTPAVESQTEGYPVCSASELAFVSALRPAYEDLVASLSADGEPSLEKTLAFTEAQIEWRGPLWERLPRCAEAIDIAVLMSQNTSDLGAMAALTYAGVSLSLNRYKDRLNFEGNNRARLAAKFDEASALIDEGVRPSEPAAGDRELEACEEDDIRSLIAELRENEDLVVQGTSVRAPGELLDYIQTKLEWRDQVWAKLPACREAIGVGRQMSQTASDLATAIAFSYVQVPAGENPFAATLSDDLTLLGDLLVFLISSVGEQVAADLESPLPDCTTAEMATATAQLSDFGALVERAIAIESTEELLAYSREILAWRAALWSAVPFCAESVEISLAAMSTVNDLAALRGLELSGEPADLKLLSETARDGVEKFGDFAGNGGLSAAAPAEAARAERLPACTEADKPFLLAIREQLGVFASLISEFKTVDDIVKYAEVHIHWRDQIWKKFPPCQEAIEAGQLLIQVTGDTVPAAALLFYLGVPQEDNPFLGEIGAARERLESYTTMFGSE